MKEQQCLLCPVYLKAHSVFDLHGLLGSAGRVVAGWDDLEVKR